MWNLDRLRSYGTQYEHMLSEYDEYVAAARSKLSREVQVDADDVDDLRQQLSSLSASASVLLQADCLVLAQQYCLYCILSPLQ